MEGNRPTQLVVSLLMSPPVHLDPEGYTLKVDYTLSHENIWKTFHVLLLVDRYERKKDQHMCLWCDSQLPLLSSTEIYLSITAMPTPGDYCLWCVRSSVRCWLTKSQW